MFEGGIVLNVRRLHADKLLKTVFAICIITAIALSISYFIRRYSNRVFISSTLVENTGVISSVAIMAPTDTSMMFVKAGPSVLVYRAGQRIATHQMAASTVILCDTNRVGLTDGKSFTVTSDCIVGGYNDTNTQVHPLDKHCLLVYYTKSGDSWAKNIQGVTNVYFTPNAAQVLVQTETRTEIGNSQNTILYLFELTGELAAQRNFDDYLEKCYFLPGGRNLMMWMSDSCYFLNYDLSVYWHVDGIWNQVPRFSETGRYIGIKETVGPTRYDVAVILDVANKRKILIGEAQYIKSVSDNGVAVVGFYRNPVDGPVHDRVVRFDVE